MAGRRVRAQRGHRLRRGVIDVDSLPVPVESTQPGSVYNGHDYERVWRRLRLRDTAKGALR